MATIIIRNLDDEVAERLRLQARLRGVSVEQEARRLLAEGTQPSRAKIAARAAAIRYREPRSIAFLWFVHEPDRWGAARLLETEAALLAPDLMAVETTNAWWKKLRRHEMDMVDVEQAVTNLLALGIAWT